MENKFIHLLYVPTMACNMNCKYCYLEDNTKDNWQDFNSLETLKYAIKKFKESNVIPFNISLHGGEVTTLSKAEFHDLIEFIATYYNDNKKIISENGFKIGRPHIKTNMYDLSKHMDTIKELGGSYLEAVSVFDVYEGEHIEEGFRSIAFNLQFRSMEGTLSDDDIEPPIQAIITALEEKKCKLR